MTYRIDWCETRDLIDIQQPNIAFTILFVDPSALSPGALQVSSLISNIAHLAHKAVRALIDRPTCSTS